MHIQKMFLPVFCLFQGAGLAQTSSSVNTLELDSTPWISTRAKGMGDALAPFADGTDAPYFNPAGIGGSHWEKDNSPVFRHVHFPYVGFAANTNSVALENQFLDQKAAADRSLGSAIVANEQGIRHFGRGSLIPLDVGYRRTIIVPFLDQQVLAVPTGESDVSTIRYRSQSGIGAGISVKDAQGKIHLGWFSSLISRKEVVGDIKYIDAASRSGRRSFIKENSTNYEAVAHNAGVLFHLGKVGRPSVAAVVRNLTDTKFDPPSQGEPIFESEDLAFAVGFSPMVGRGVINYAIEVGRLTEPSVSLAKKIRTGLEYQTGGAGFLALWSCRVGYNGIGASFGTSLNLGLLGFELASSVEDLGMGNTRITERQYSATFNINVGE